MIELKKKTQKTSSFLTNQLRFVYAFKTFKSSTQANVYLVNDLHLM